MTGAGDNKPSEPWHLDKRVPIALIIAIAMQTMGIVWWASSLDHRVRTIEREVMALMQADSVQRDELRRTTEYLARLDERVSQMMGVLREMRDELRARR